MVNSFSKKYGLNKLPKYVFGISSGAAFAQNFPRTIPMQGVVSGECRGLAALPACALACAVSVPTPVDACIALVAA